VNNNYLTVFVKLILAVFLGALIGYERESSNRPAGLRTNILVCLGATLIQILSLDIFAAYSDLARVDPGRLGAQVISGIGFLGAGTIIHEGVSVKGLTTAAGLWVVACIGLAIGNGSYFSGIAATVLAFLTLRALKGLEGHVGAQDSLLNLEIRLKDKPGQIGKIGQVLADMNVNIKNIGFIEHDLEQEILNVCLTVQYLRQAEKQKLLESINSLDGVCSVKELG